MYSLIGGILYQLLHACNSKFGIVIGYSGSIYINFKYTAYSVLLCDKLNNIEGAGFRGKAMIKLV